MAYAKSPGSASAAPAAINQSPAAITWTPVDATYTQVPEGIAAGVLDGLPDTPRAAYSQRRRLVSTYALGSPLVRVRKTTGGDTTTEQDIGFVAATGLRDEAALAAFVGSESWVVVTTYDQMTGARPVTNATAANQPTGGTAGAAVTLSGFPAADLDGVNDYWARADALGLSGAVALSMWVDCTYDAMTGLPIAIGTNAAGTVFYIHNNSNTLLKIAIVGSERVFTAASALVGRQRLIARIPAGAGIGAAKLMQNGVELAESSAINPANTLNLGTAATALGAFVTGGAPQDGKLAEAAFFNADISAGTLAQINGLS